MPTRSCTCCIDDLTVFDGEAEPIRRHYSQLLTRAQVLPLRWIDEFDDGTPVARRDICPLNDDGAPIETLPEDQCWSIGPFEAELADLKKEMIGGQMRRVALRSLFG